jgi:LysR family hydrogen peroxide-inducible transcriptional activator
MGATLLPALALRSAGAGVVTRQLEVPDAYRRVSLVWRRSFPRVAAVEALAEVILANLPNTVRVAGAARRDTRSNRPRAGARK